MAIEDVGGIPVAFPNQIGEASWLNEERFRWFRDGYHYACTQTRAIPALAKLTPEELYAAVTAINRGAKFYPSPREGEQHGYEADAQTT